MAHVRRTLRDSLLLLALASPLVAAAASGPGGSVVLRVFYGETERIRLLEAFDLFEFRDAEAGYVLAAATAEEIEAIVARGFRVEIDRERTDELFGPRAVSPTQVTGIPGFPCYRTVEESYATAAQIAADHPNLATWTDIGDSWQKTAGLGGYDLMVLRLTNAAIPGPKPKFFLHGAIHAREYTTAELATRFAEYLVDNYGIDADATWILDHQEVHLLLQANPDGRKQAETGLAWRKNTNQNYCSPTSTNRGADLNRNLEFEWGCCGGSSGSPCNELYRGPSAGSEPEVQAIEAYLVSQFPDQRDEALSAPAPADATGLYLDLHSFGELVIWPWGFAGTAPNASAFRTLGRKFAWFNDYTPQQAIELYATDGTTMDFGYGELGVASYAFELGTAFFQSCSTFESTVLADNLPALVYAAKASRTPYLTPAGPDAFGATAAPGLVDPGQPVLLTATVDDTHFNNSNGTEATQNIAAAEYYIDTPPWVVTPASVAHPMSAADGSFDEKNEGATASIDTSGLAGGRHIVFLRGRDASGNWGAFHAAFFWVSGGPGGTVSGTLTEQSSGVPLDGSVTVGALGVGTSSNAGSGAYSLALPIGTWTLRATATDHIEQLAGGVIVEQGQATTVDFALAVADLDGDGVGDSIDCDSEDPQTWASPSPARQLMVGKSFGNLTWLAPAEPGADAVTYDVLRANGPDDFANATCLVKNQAGSVATDGLPPATGEGFYYLVRASNRCGETLGFDSFGVPRSGIRCP